MASNKSRRGASRLARTLRSLAIIAAIGGVLAAYNIISTSRNVATVTGPVGPAQEALFVQFAERPDLELFYKGMTSAQRLTMAQRLGEYDDPPLATVIGKLLGTFDPEARKALGESLAKLAKKQPDAVSAQFSLAGSFQQLAVSNALKAVGAPALPLVVKRLDDEPTRANALAFLVDFGPEAVPVVLPKLDSDKADVRIAAADALGKLAARDAVPHLTEMYGKAEGAEKIAYLSALASIGDPRSEGLLRAALLDETLTMPQRAQAALGLGRVGGKSAVAALRPFADDPDRQFRESVRSALMLTGDAAITDPSLPLALRVELAGGVHSAAANALLTSALRDPSLRVVAAKAAFDRPELVPALVAAARTSTDGEMADSLLRALATTKAGRTALTGLEGDPSLGGLASRRESIGAG